MILMTTTGYVIQLASGRLWSNLGAQSAAIFTTRQNAEQTINGFSGRGALANPVIRELATGAASGREKIEGYWLA